MKGIMQDPFLYTVVINFIKKSEYATFRVVYGLAEREHRYPEFRLNLVP